MRDRSGPILWSGTHSLRLSQDVAKRASRTISYPMLKRRSLYPVIAVIVLMQFTRIGAMWASCGENDEPHDEKKPEQRSDEQEHREAASYLSLHICVTNP